MCMLENIERTTEEHRRMTHSHHVRQILIFHPRLAFNSVQSIFLVAGENVCKFSSLVSLMQYAHVAVVRISSRYPKMNENSICICESSKILHPRFPFDAPQVENNNGNCILTSIE